MFTSPVRNGWFWIAVLVACYFAGSFRVARSDLVRLAEQKPFCLDVGAVDVETGKPLDGFHIIDAGSATLTDFQAIGDPASQGIRMRILGVGTMPITLTVEREGYQTTIESIHDPFPTFPMLFRMKKQKKGEPGATDNPDDAQRLREDH